MINLKNIVISGKEVCPIIEGGKGINGTDGRSSGHFAKEGCVGRFRWSAPTIMMKMATLSWSGRIV